MCQRPGRSVLVLLGALIMVGYSGTSWAASTENATGVEYPTRTVRVIVPTSTGGGTDFIARIFAQKLSETWGRPVVVENRAGASGFIGMEILANAAPDGHTVIVCNIGHALSAAFARNARVDVYKSYATVSQLASYPEVLVVHPSVPVKSVSEFIALAKAQPKKLYYASGGNGGLQHITTESLKQEAKIDMVHVPFKGTSPGVVALVGGGVQLTISSIPPVLSFVKSGRLRALAVTGKERAGVLPELPTFVESGYPGVVFEPWFGMLAPANTPRPVLDKIASAVGAIGNAPDVRTKISSAGLDPQISGPDEFSKVFKRELERWLKSAQEAGITGIEE